MDLMEMIKDGYPLEYAYLLVGGSDAGDLGIAKAFAGEDNVFTFDLSDEELMRNELESGISAATRGEIMLQTFLNRIERNSKDGKKSSVIVNLEDLSGGMEAVLTCFVDGQDGDLSERKILLIIRASEDEVINDFSPLIERCVVIYEGDKKMDGTRSVKR